MPVADAGRLHDADTLHDAGAPDGDAGATVSPSDAPFPRIALLGIGGGQA